MPNSKYEIAGDYVEKYHHFSLTIATSQPEMVTDGGRAAGVRGCHAHGHVSTEFRHLNHLLIPHRSSTLEHGAATPI
jgi:hypothetical protein